MVAVCVYIQGDQKVSVHPMSAVRKTSKNILNSFIHHDNVVRIRETDGVSVSLEHSSVCQ
jgi:predicted hydrolase (HD superfamily)